MKNKLIMFISTLALVSIGTYLVCRDASVVNIMFLSIMALASIALAIDVAVCAYKKKKGLSIEQEEIHFEFDKVKNWLWIPLVLFGGVVGLVAYFVMFIANKKKDQKVD